MTVNDSSYWAARRRAEDAALKNHASTHECLQNELEDAKAIGFRFEQQGGYLVPVFDGLTRNEAYIKYCEWVEARYRR